MTLSIIWAMGKNREIGLNNKLPWNLPEDLKHFKKMTSGKPVIMGYKTFQSIGKPLPGRKNIILTSKKIRIEGCVVVNSIDEALKLVKDEDTFVIGGSKIYEQFLKFADKLYVTFIDDEFEADSFFPNFDLSHWELVSEDSGIKDEKNNCDYYFRIYKKSQGL